jgi:hypothetical protein
MKSLTWKMRVHRYEAAISDMRSIIAELDSGKLTPHQRTSAWARLNSACRRALTQVGATSRRLHDPNRDAARRMIEEANRLNDATWRRHHP